MYVYVHKYSIFRNKKKKDFVYEPQIMKFEIFTYMDGECPFKSVDGEREIRQWPASNVL